MRRFLLKLFRRRALERDFEAEIAFHREMASAYENRIGLGNTAVIKDQAFDLWRFNFAENLWRDLVYGVRRLRGSPGFVLSALLSLGLGIGVNTAVFSLTVEFLFSEPSVEDPRSLVALRVGGNSHSSADIVDAVAGAGIFSHVAGENEETFVNWNNGVETRPIFSVVATKNYFTALGVPMAHGRGWNVSDPDEVAVLRHAFWRKHFNGDPSVVGRLINLDGRAYTVLGILPENHRTLLGYGFSPDVYMPRFLDDTVLAMYARLKPGMHIAEARAATSVLAPRLNALRLPHGRTIRSISVTPIAGLDRLHDEGGMARVVGLFFAMVLLVVGLVLLIACVNVASLLLARASARRQETAIRLSLGASRGRMVQQFLVESLLLSLLGAAAGLLLAQSAAAIFARIQLPLPLPIRLQVELDWRVLTYAALLAATATVACGLLPAWQAVKEAIGSHLHRERRLHVRRALVAAQISVSVVVLVTGFLFLRNLIRSTATSPGFDVQQTLRAEVHLPPALYKDKARKNLLIEQTLRELESLPGIEAAAAARIIPFTDSTTFGSDLSFPGSSEKTQASFHWNAVSSDYFRAMAIPVLAGHSFAGTDGSLERPVVINDTFAKRYLANRNPIDTVFLLGDGRYRVIGLVSATKNLTIGEDDKPQLYESLRRIDNDRTRIQFVLRSQTPPVTQLQPVREALRRIEPRAGVEVTTLYSSIGLAFLPSQVGGALLGTIGLLGLLLAVIGLYGVIAFSVARRTREIGVRIAIGATRRQISTMVIVEALKLIVVGSAIGIAAGLFVTRPLAMFFVPGLSPADPLTYFTVVLVLAAAGLVATWGPVRRASSVDPVACLRYE